MAVDKPPTEAEPVDVAIGTAIEALRKQAGLTQGSLGELAGFGSGAQGGAGQRKISYLETGEQPCSIAQMLAIETTLDRPHGTILRMAGVITEPVDVEAAIRADTTTSQFQDTFVRMYQAARDEPSLANSALSATPTSRSRRRK